MTAVVYETNSGLFRFIIHFKYDHDMRTEKDSKEITGGYKILNHKENV
jgi:hypothetical protein